MRSVIQIGRGGANFQVYGVGTRPLARDWTVAWGVAGNSTTRPNQRYENATAYDGKIRQPDTEQAKCPCSHGTNVTTYWGMACDQHDRTITIDTPQPSVPRIQGSNIV